MIVLGDELRIPYITSIIYTWSCVMNSTTNTTTNNNNDDDDNNNNYNVIISADNKW